MNEKLYEANIFIEYDIFCLKYLFQKMEAPFLAAVKETLEDRYTENMETIYKITIHFILQTVVEGFEAAQPNSV